MLRNEELIFKKKAEEQKKGKLNVINVPKFEIFYFSGIIYFQKLIFFLKNFLIVGICKALKYPKYFLNEYCGIQIMNFQVNLYEI